VVQLAGRGPEILTDQNFWGAEILEFPALRFFAKSFFSSCGATLSEGPEFLAGIFRMKISGGRNFRPQAEISALSGPRNFQPLAGISGVSRLQRIDFELAYK
jgi:hypothetical protein